MTTFDEESLEKFNGEAGTPVYIALKEEVFDVSAGRSFYGPGGGYAVLGGRNASRALAKMDLAPANVRNVTIDDLNEKEVQTLNQWYDRLKSKYPVVGKFKPFKKSKL